MKFSLFLALSVCLLLNASAGGTPGLTYNYYEGTWNSLPDFNTLTSIKKGVTANMTLDPRRREELYAFLWQGFITIPAAGTYTFETNSDDGSKLYIGPYGFNTVPVVDNDGLHPDRFVTGSISLNAGVYPISISFFQNGGNQTMEVYWSSNSGLARTLVANNVLTVDDPSTPGLTVSYFEGVWDSLPNFRIIPYVKKEPAANVSLAIRNRDKQYAFLWQGNITIPASGNYTFETISDDGSKFYIGPYDVDTKALVDNEGLHPNQLATGTMFLNAGVYPVAITFFQSDGDQTMEVYWSSSTGITRQRIPDNAFGGTRTIDAPPPTGGLTSNTNNYHFSTSTGDDSRTPEQALNVSTPWKTIGKLNSIMPGLRPGDAVLFKRDEVFDGGIIMAQSGTLEQPIIFSAYGSGSKPVINGLRTLTNWASSGNGTWEANCSSGVYLNMLMVNGIVKGMGRFPNLTDPNRGYLSYESHRDSTQITDDQFDRSVNWTGAELVVRKNEWVLDRGVITNQSGNTLSFKSPTAHEPNDGFGYFIQNSPLTLDQLGEWYYNPVTKKVRVYFGSNDPNNYTVKASVVDTLVLVNHMNYITFDNLFLMGADVDAFRLRNAYNIHIQNSDFDCSGFNAINSYVSPYLSIENNTINHSNNSAIRLDSASFFALVKNNAIRNSGLIPGMGGTNNQQYNGIFSESTPTNIIELNTVDSSGYCGITFTGDYTTVKNNVVNHFCLTLSDGGGIYTWGGWNVSGREISGNVVLNGMGAPEGTSSTVAGGAVGIYLDDRSTNINISDNTVANCSRAGLIIHNSHEIKTTGNTLYNNRIQLSIVHDDLEVKDPVKNLITSNNILSASNTSQLLIENVSSLNDINNFGTYDYNYYARPMDENGVIYTNAKIAGNYKNTSYNLAQWKAKFGYDLHSAKSPVAIPSFSVNNITGANKYANGSFNNNVDGVVCQSSPGTATATFNNNGKLDGGAIQVSFDESSGATNNVAIYLDLGAVSAGRNYLVRFSLLSAAPGKTVKAFIMQNGFPWSRLSDIRFFEFSATRSENQFVFTSLTTETDVMIGFEASGNDCPYWLDNFQMNEANITFTNPDDYMRFEYNLTGKAKTVSLDDTYVDVKNNVYAGEVTINPFSSVILMKKSLQVASQAASNQLTASQMADMQATSMTVKLSPNPVHEKLMIDYALPVDTRNASIGIYSLSGIKLRSIPISSNTNIAAVDVSGLNNGVYLINIIYDGHIVTRKFVKQP